MSRVSCPGGCQDRRPSSVFRPLLSALVATLFILQGCASDPEDDPWPGWSGTGDGTTDPADPRGAWPDPETGHADGEPGTLDSEPAEVYTPPTAAEEADYVEEDAAPVTDEPHDSLLPYMIMTAPDPEVAGWQATEEPEVAPFVQTVFLETGFPHVLPKRPRPLVGASWRPWHTGRAIAVRGDELLVVDRDADRLVTLHRTTGEVVRTVPVGEGPEQIVVGPDGVAWITVSGAGELVSVPAGAEAVEARIHLGLEPMGLALEPAAGVAFVTLRAEGRVVAVELPTTSQPAVIHDVASDFDMPRDLALNLQGLLTVVHRGESVTQLLIQDLAPADHEGGVRDVALRRSNPYEGLLLEDRASRSVAGSARAAVVHPETGDTLVTHYQRLPGTADSMIEAATLVANPPPTTSGSPPVYYGPPPEWNPSHRHVARTIEASVTVARSDGATHEEPTLPVRDPQTLEPVTTRIDQPSDINHHPLLSVAFVVGHGTDNVLMLNTSVADPMRAPLGLIEVGMGPRAIAFSEDGRHAYVLSEHSRAVSEVDLIALMTADAPSADAPYDGAVAHPMPSAGLEPHDELMDVLTLRHQRWVSFGPDALPDDARLGRRIFTFARNPRISGTSQFACASCHIDGGEDQTTWFFAAGPRQTPALAGRLAGTAPFNWNGTKSKLQDNFRRTIDRMGGEGLTSTELNALASFLDHHLEERPNPHAPNGKALTEAQMRGKALFERADVGCANCHVGPELTDGQVYDLGTASSEEQQVHQILSAVEKADPLVFNTPSLRGLWHTAPYLHDGSAATLYEVLDETSMGHTDHLTAPERADLVAYLRSL